MRAGLQSPVLPEMFWLLAGMLLGGAVTALFHRLLSYRPGQAHRQEALSTYQKKLAELRASLQEGRLSDEQAAPIQRELGHGLLQVLDEETEPGQSPQLRLLWPALALIALLPLLVVLLYLELGSPQLAQQATAPGQTFARMPDVPGVPPGVPSIEGSARAAQLESFLQQQPDQADVWRELARLRMEQSNYAEAVRAAERLYALKGDDPAALLLYADALAMAHEGRLAGLPADLVQKALKLDPSNKIALWLAGMAAREQGDRAEALRYWRQLEPRLDGHELASLQAQIEAAEAPPQNAPGAAPPQPLGAEPVAGPLIWVEVSLDASLQEQVQPEDVLYVFARAPSGPPFPIAVVRRQVRDLPLRIALDDTMAILPDRRLSAFEQVQVGARISFSGDALPRSGDLLAQPGSVKVGAADPVQIIIDHAQP